MRSSFWIGASGLFQHQRALDVVSQNVANVNTHGFKGSHIHFGDVFYDTMGLGGAPDEGLRSVNPIQKGHGAATAAISRNFSQGTPDLTGRALDLMILGPGFFVVRPPDAEEHEVYYTRAGHFQIDANGGVTPGYPLDQDSFVPPGPINLVSPQGYVLQGVNASIDPATGQYVLPDSPTLEDIVFDPTGVLGPFATTRASFGLNLDARQPLAIDPAVFRMEHTGVDRTVRIEFQRASLTQPNGDTYYLFWVQDPVPNADGSHTTITDGRTGELVSGVIRLSSDGVVSGVFQNPDAGDSQSAAAGFRTGTGAFLTDDELFGLVPWANVDGPGNPIFTVGTAPVLGGDTRIDVRFGMAGQPIGFLATSVPGYAIDFHPRDPGEVVVGTTMSAFDSLGNEHSLSFSFQRLSTNRWMWEARPVFRVENPPTAVTDSALGGGTTADGIFVLPNALIANPDGTFRISILIDEGAGPIPWQQVPPGAPWPSTSSLTGYFQVVDPVTGEIAFSRDINTTSPNFRLYTEYASATTAGSGLIAFDRFGNYDETQSAILSPLTFTPPGAATIAFTPDFSALKGQRRQSDVTVIDSDGFRAGTLSRWGFDNQGRIVADYTNGLQQYLARVTLATFANPEGLQARGENMFLASANTGRRTLLHGGHLENVGISLVAGALESSNVNISDEFANMIVFQRAYQFNSRIITTTDEMIREAITMKR